MDQSTEDYVVGLPGRYALSLFELAQEEDEKDFVEKIDQELLTVGDIINSNNDLSALIKSPIFSSTEQLSLMTDILKKIGVNPMINNFIGVLCENRRLSLLPNIIRAFHAHLLVINKKRPIISMIYTLHLFHEICKYIFIKNFNPLCCGSMVAKHT